VQRAEQIGHALAALRRPGEVPGDEGRAVFMGQQLGQGVAVQIGRRAAQQMGGGRRGIADGQVGVHRHDHVDGVLGQQAEAHVGHLGPGAALVQQHICCGRRQRDRRWCVAGAGEQQLAPI
jgi:hypothetical protein